MIRPELLLGKNFGDIVLSEVFAPFQASKPEMIETEGYVEMPEAGLSLVLLEDMMIDTVHLYSDGYDSYSGYAQQLPEGIDFNMSRDQVRSKIGIPSMHSEGIKVPILGEKPAWDLFLRSKYKLHVEYAPNKLSVQLVTVSRQK
jgi:hypothetical protein